MQGPNVVPAAEQMNRDGEAVFRPACMPACVQLLRELISMDDPMKSRFEMEVSRRISTLFDLLVSDRFFPVRKRGEDSLSNRTASYLEAHYKEKLRFDDLSQMLYVSRNQLIRVFERDTGYTPYEYLKRYRLLKACELLQMTSLPVGDIGRQTGFRNSSNFSSQFHRQYGITPQAYRRLYGTVSGV